MSNIVEKETLIEILSWVASMGSLIKLLPQIYHLAKKPEHAIGLSSGMLFCGTISGFASIGIGILKELPYFVGGYSAVTCGYLILVCFKCRKFKPIPVVTPTIITANDNGNVIEHV